MAKKKSKAGMGYNQEHLNDAPDISIDDDDDNFGFSREAIFHGLSPDDAVKSYKKLRAKEEAAYDEEFLVYNDDEIHRLELMEDTSPHNETNSPDTSSSETQEYDSPALSEEKSISSPSPEPQTSLPETPTDTNIASNISSDKDMNIPSESDFDNEDMEVDEIQLSVHVDRRSDTNEQSSPSMPVSKADPDIHDAENPVSELLKDVQSTVPPLDKKAETNGVVQYIPSTDSSNIKPLTGTGCICVTKPEQSTDFVSADNVIKAPTPYNVTKSGYDIEGDIKPMMLGAKFIEENPIKKYQQGYYFFKQKYKPCFYLISKEMLEQYALEQFSDICMRKGSPEFVSQIAKSVMMQLKPESDESVEKTEKRYFATLNQLYDVKNNRVLPLDPDIFLTWYLNVKTDPSATRHPVFDRFLDTATDGIEANKRAILEMMAYYLFPSVYCKAFFTLKGRSNTGKSVLLNLIQSFFPEDAVSNVSLQELGSKFSTGSIAVSRINIEADLPDKTISQKDMSILKKITGGDKIVVEGKYKQGYSCKLKCKFLFATNHRLRITGEDEAFIKRLHIIPFDHVISPEEQDVELLSKLEKEKPAIFNTLYRYYQGLRANCYSFTHCVLPENSINLIITAETDDSALNSFFSNYLEYTGDSSDFVPTSAIEERFKEYALDNDMKHMVPGFSQQFSRFINQSSMSEVRSVRRGIGKQRGYCALRLINL